MPRRGRPAASATLLRRLKGSPAAKRRAAVFLDLVAGRLAVSDACLQLGISPALLRRLRIRSLQAVLQALEPRRPGRPPRAAQARSSRLARLEEALSRARTDLAYARVREELALLLPRIGRGKGRERPRPSSPAATPSASRSPSAAGGSPGPPAPAASA